MNDKPPHEWTDKELADQERDYPYFHPTHGDRLKAEIDRRRARTNQRYTFWGVVFAAVAAFGSMIAAFASWFAVLSK